MKIFIYACYGIFLIVLIVVADVIYAKFFEQLPSLRNTIYVQMNEAAIHKRSKIKGLFYELRPNAIYQSVRINSFGMRDQEPTINKSDYRVIVLGDSVTFGGVTIHEHKLFTKVAENILNADDKRFEILNAGVNGYNTKQEFIALKNKYLSLNPDLILFAFCINDVSDSMIQYLPKDYVQQKIAKANKRAPNDSDYTGLTKIQYLELALPKNFPIPYKWDRWLLAHSSICRTLSLRIFSQTEGMKDKNALSAFLFSCNFEITLSQIKKFAQETGIIIKFIILPTRNEHGNTIYARQCLEANNIDFCDLDLYVRNNLPKNPSLWANDGAHLTVSGHALVGQLLAQTIRGWIKDE